MRLGRQGDRTPRPTHGKCHTDYQLDVCDPFHVGEMPHTPLDASTFRIYQNYSVNATVNKRKALARLYPKATGSALRGGGVTLTLTGG